MKKAVFCSIIILERSPCGNAEWNYADTSGL
jgi:hypothetical protein